MCLVELLVVMLIVVGTTTGALFGPGVFIIIMLVGVPAVMVVYFVTNRFAEGFSDFAVGGRLPWKGPALATDRAEGFIAQQEYDAALYAYQEALNKARGPQRLPIMLKLGETAQLAQRWDEALHWWREALHVKRGLKPDQRASIMFRMAEVLQDQYQDARAAAALLHRVETEYPESEYARYAAERLRVLASRERSA